MEGKCRKSEITDTPGALRWDNGAVRHSAYSPYKSVYRWSAKGALYLTNMRIVFVADQEDALSGELSSEHVRMESSSYNDL